MLEMYEKYGYYKDAVIAVAHKGIEGLAKIKSIMENLRNNPPKTIGDYKVLKTRNYDKDEIVDLATGEKTTTGIPKSNVLYYEMEGDAWLAVRPSGTEPKIKFYFGLKGDSLEQSAELSKEFEVKLQGLINSLVNA
jgi:phosphoglucomutase